LPKTDISASIASIVADAGVTKGALFHHFPSKLDLFREVWTDLQTRMGEEARLRSAQDERGG
jgi:AcrR family transcriptional regulator